MGRWALRIEFTGAMWVHMSQHTEDGDLDALGGEEAFRLCEEDRRVVRRSVPVEEEGDLVSGHDVSLRLQA